MILDNKGRLFGKVSVIDIFVVIFVIFLLASGIYKYVDMKQNSTTLQINKNEEELLITYIVEEAPGYVADSLKLGSVAKESIQKVSIGELIDFEVGPSVSWASTFQGEYIKSTKEGYNSINMNIKGKGYFDETGVKINNGSFFVGKYINIEVGESILWGRISSITKI